MEKARSSFSIEYDAEEDILYLLLTDKATKAIAEEVSDEVFVRFEPGSKKVVSIEVLNFRHRLEHALGEDLKYLGSTLQETFVVPKELGR